MTVIRVRYSLDSLTRYLGEIPKYVAMRSKTGGFTSVVYTIDVSHDGQPLLRLDESSVSITAPPALRDDAVEILDRAGVFPLEFEFMGAEPFNPVHEIGRTSGDLRGWLVGLLDTLGDSVHLIPDTNFLRRHYYSNYFLPLLPQLESRPLHFGLSRLTILEVESMHNRAKKNRKSKSDSKIKAEQTGKATQDIEIALRRDEKEVRVAYFTVKEILALKRNGAQELPAPDMTLVQTFTDKAGDYGDAWIRREIARPIPFQYGEAVTPDKSRILVTCDLMNALAAIAEGINTIYVARMEEPSATGYLTHGCGQQASIILNAAIQLGECDCALTLAGEVKKFKIIGMWSGKSMSDWLYDVVMREGDESSLLE